MKDIFSIRNIKFRKVFGFSKMSVLPFFRVKTHSICLILFLFTSMSFLWAQNLEASFKHISVSDGLSQSSVISIVQDKDGLIWMGTRDGLNKYDGRKFEVYKKRGNNSLSNNDITTIVPDRNGDLWIGTYSGLTRYDYQKDSFVQFFHDPKNESSLSNNRIFSIIEDRDGFIWVGTANGLNRFDKRNKRFDRFFHDPQNMNSLSASYINVLFQDKSGILWVGTRNGLNKVVWDTEGRPVFKKFFHDNKNNSSISDGFIRSITEDKNGNIWIGTKFGGLSNYIESTDSFVNYLNDPADESSISDNDVRCLLFDNRNRLWVGTYKGLNILNVKDQSFQRLFNDLNDPGSISKNTIRSLFMDDNRQIWVGTYYGGANILESQYFNFKNYRFKTNQEGLSYDVISSVVEDNEGNIFIGTEGGGINKLNINTNVIEYIVADDPTLIKKNIKSLYFDSKNNSLLIGTFKEGLHTYSLKSKKLTSYRYDKSNLFSISDNNVYSIVQENDSLFWVGTLGGGLNLFDLNSEKFYNSRNNITLKLTSDFIRVLFKDSGGNLWIGTQFGLNFLSNKDICNGDYKFTSFFYDLKTGTGEDILSIFEDRQSRLWVGTNETGLNLFDPENLKFDNFGINKAMSIVGDMVHGILQDDLNNLWCSTNQGLVKLNLIDSTYKTYDESDGLISNEYNNNSCLRAKNGNMYFGSLKGLVSFDPENISENCFSPPVVLTAFKLFGEKVDVDAEDGILKKSISSTKQLILNHNQSNFTIEFAIPNYISSNKNYFAYRLKGLENQWNSTNGYSATYTIQNPGTYTFEIKGANNDGIWGKEATTLEIILKPPFWKTWWAYLFYFLIISFTLFLLIYIILSRFKFKHELELEHIKLEEQNSSTQMKLQFFTNLSHEFRNPLVLILGPLEDILSNYKGSNSLYKKLLIIEKNAQRLLNLINQLMDFRKFENNHLKLNAAEGNIVAFVKEVFLSFKQLAQTQNIKYSFFSEKDDIQLWYDRDKMERVIYNLLSNAFKFTPVGGTIEVRVENSVDYVKLSVYDNGQGIKPENIPHIFERFFVGNSINGDVGNSYYKGTGIGLALAKGIVEMHSGEITVASDVNERTEFTVILRKGYQHLKEDEILKDFKNSDDIANYKQRFVSDLKPIENFEIPDVQKHEHTLLIVEDNIDVRKFISQIFNDKYNLLEAENGREGLRKALQSSPDVIISDVMMPEMDGIEFCSQVKTNIKTSHIPFILLTARTSFVFKFEGLEMGADDYISKPFSIKELQLKVRNLLNAQSKFKLKFSQETVVKPSDIMVSSLDEELFKKALGIVDKNISNEFFNVPTFCEELGVSRTLLFTKIKAWTNLTPNDFIQMMRIKRAAKLLEQNKLSVAEVGYHVGFKSPKYFSKCFQQHYAVLPSVYAKKFVGVE